FARASARARPASADRARRWKTADRDKARPWERLERVLCGRFYRLNVLHDQLQLAPAQPARAGFGDGDGIADAGAAFAFLRPHLRLENESHAGLQLNFREALQILVAEQRRAVVAETARVHDRMVPQIFSAPGALDGVAVDVEQKPEGHAGLHLMQNRIEAGARDV